MPGKTRQASPGDFQLLGLPFGAPPDKVKKAYKAFVKAWHPDRFPQGSRQQRLAEDRLKEANAAYRRIRNDWEAGAAESQPQPASPAAPPRGPRQGAAASATGVSPSRAWFFGLKLLREQIQALSRTFRAGRIWPLLLLLLPLLAVLIEFEPSSPPKEQRESSAGRTVEPLLPIERVPSLPELPEPTSPLETPRTVPPPSAEIPPLRPPHQDTQAPSHEKTFFSLGSTKAEVLRVQGKPAKVYGQTWVYGLSDVTFREGRVWRYHNFDGSLRVQMLPSVPNANGQNPESFTIGATKEEVLRVQGTPTHAEGNKWSYGFSEIYFRDGVVIGFNNFFNNLKVTMRPLQGSDATPAKGYFTIGSSQDEVLALQGTPTIVQGNLWSYQLSDVLFVDGRVRSVNDFSGILKFSQPDSLIDK